MEPISFLSIINDPFLQETDITVCITNIKSSIFFIGVFIIIRIKLLNQPYAYFKLSAIEIILRLK
jgi:hypothetical protein